MLPPPLEPDEPPGLLLECFMYVPCDGDERIIQPGPARGEAGGWISARFRGRGGLFELVMDPDQDYGRSAGRKQQRLHEKDGRVQVGRHVDRILASPRWPHPELRWKAEHSILGWGRTEAEMGVSRGSSPVGVAARELLLPAAP